jgi:hypothetical protein
VGCVDEPAGFDKNRGAIFGRRGVAAAVRSEAEDERASPAASNPTLSARNKKGLSSGPFYFWGCGVCDEPAGFDKNRGAIFGRRGVAEHRAAATERSRTLSTPGHG